MLSSLIFILCRYRQQQKIRREADAARKGDLLPTWGKRVKRKNPFTIAQEDDAQQGRNAKAQAQTTEREQDKAGQEGEQNESAFRDDTSI